jgi:hypothetical protein
MMLHGALPTIAGVAHTKPEHLPPELAESTAGLRRVWHKFVSDLTPLEFERFCDEVWLCRDVDALERYLSTILFDVFVQRPETLRSSEQVRVSDLLDCGDMMQLVRKLAERKVTELSYHGFEDLLSYLRDKLGLPIDLADPNALPVREAVEVRNIVVHNGGIVNALFLRRTKRENLTEGIRFPLDQDYVLNTGRAAFDLVAKLDAAFISHFRLSYGPQGTATGRDDA